MKLSSGVGMGVLVLKVALLAAALRADGPVKKAEAVKQPWQRLLEGEDARKHPPQDIHHRRRQAFPGARQTGSGRAGPRCR
jgi:hypothetical protein